MVSVIIPTYNRAGYLKEAIDSVLGQAFMDFEIIVVDDGSTDNTKEAALSYGDKIKYISQDNKERGAARNNGIAHAKGEYVAFLDSDDLWMPDHLGSCINSMDDNPDAGLVYSGSYMVDENGIVISKEKPVLPGDSLLETIVSSYSSGGCNASSCLIKKKIFCHAGYFSEDRDLSGSEDWEMWARLASVTKFIYTGKHTAKIRSHGSRFSLNADKMARSAKKSLDMIYQNEAILPKIKYLRKKAYSSLYTMTAINYYAQGDMKIARGYLRLAAREYPLSIFANKYLIYTLLRSLLGGRFSAGIRQSKRAFNSILYTNEYDR